MNYDQFTNRVINYVACYQLRNNLRARCSFSKYLHICMNVYMNDDGQFPQHIRTRTARAYNHIVTLRSFSAHHSLISVECTKNKTIAVSKIERNRSRGFTL